MKVIHQFLDPTNRDYTLVFGPRQWGLYVSFWIDPTNGWLYVSFWILPMGVIYQYFILSSTVGISMDVVKTAELYIFYFELDICLCKYMNI